MSRRVVFHHPRAMPFSYPNLLGEAQELDLRELAYPKLGNGLSVCGVTSRGVMGCGTSSGKHRNHPGRHCGVMSDVSLKSDESNVLLRANLDNLTPLLDHRLSNRRISSSETYKLEKRILLRGSHSSSLAWELNTNNSILVV
ncbi:hypothetical protein RUM43_010171 [Polyplax serrata]|uniref:Uncharacterized protein n=1 Tax=Polyplax serrata TaxID=468196 RepID=A0AAN8P744_POLSC